MATSRLSLILSALLTHSLFFVFPCHAHLRMSKPPALRGRDHPAYAWNSNPPIDYGIANPLTGQSDYPCKGYHKDVPSFTQATETVQAGQQYSITVTNLEGTDHGGGSCQISLSYDGGASFGTIHSFIGGCPIAPNNGDTDTLTFTFPKETPAGKNVILSWTWITKTGLMEFYQNCAAINIESSSSSMTVPAVVRASVGAKAAVCQVVWNNELIFPNPGKYVTYGGTYAAQTPQPDASQTTGCTQDELGMGTVTLQSNGETVGTPEQGGTSEAGDQAKGGSPATTGSQNPSNVRTDETPQPSTQTDTSQVPSISMPPRAEAAEPQVTQDEEASAIDTSTPSSVASPASSNISSSGQSTASGDYPAVSGGGVDCKSGGNRKRRGGHEDMQDGKYGHRGSRRERTRHGQWHEGH